MKCINKMCHDRARVGDVNEYLNTCTLFFISTNHMYSFWLGEPQRGRRRTSTYAQARALLKTGIWRGPPSSRPLRRRRPLKQAVTSRPVYAARLPTRWLATATSTNASTADDASSTNVATTCATNQRRASLPSTNHDILPY